MNPLPEIIKDNQDKRPYFIVMIGNVTVGVITINHPEFYCGSIIHVKDSQFN